MKKIFFVSLAIIAAGCANKGINSSNELSLADKANDGSFIYKPAGREQFVFGEILPSLQKYAYRDICYEMPKKSVSSDCNLNKLPYDKYVGLKGYYTEKNAFKDKNNKIVREVVIENGEIAYLVSDPNSKYVGSNILTLEKYNEIKNFNPYPIVEGGAVKVIGYSTILRDNFILNNGNKNSISKKSLQLIRKVAKMYPENSSRIADLLSNLIIEEDEFDNRIIISDGIGNDYGPKLSMKIIIRQKNDVSSYYIVEYHAEDWIFADRISMSIDGKIWNSPTLDFSREYNNGIIEERAFTKNNRDSLTAFKNLSNSENPKVRIYGKQYSDGKISKENKAHLGYFVELIKLLNSN